MTSLAELLESKPVLLADGATGTTLFGMGLEAGYAPELWNDEHPERIESLHQGFLDAGCDIILTNTFGGTRHRLKLHEAQDRVVELNQLGAEIACRVAESVERPIVVAGSVGPTGELLEPLGSLTYTGAVEAFVEQIEGLKAGGADVIWIETMSAADEIRAAIEAAIAVDMPYVYTASFDTAGNTMMGLPPGQLPHVWEGLESAPVACGANCGVGASDLLNSILHMTLEDDRGTVIAKANCGIPQIRGDKVLYTGTPDLMADYVRLAIDAGARIIGGCCGTTLEHLQAMRLAIDTHERRERPDLETIVSTIGPLVSPPAAMRERGEQTGRRRASRRRQA